MKAEFQNSLMAKSKLKELRGFLVSCPSWVELHFASRHLIFVFNEKFISAKVRKDLKYSFAAKLRDEVRLHDRKVVCDKEISLKSK